MKLSLESFRGLWWDLIESLQPVDIPAKPTESQVVNENTELHYAKETKRDRSGGRSAPEVRKS